MRKLILMLMLVLGAGIQAQEFDFSCGPETSELTLTVRFLGYPTIQHVEKIAVVEGTQTYSFEASINDDEHEANGNYRFYNIPNGTVDIQSTLGDDHVDVTVVLLGEYDPGTDLSHILNAQNAIKHILTSAQNAKVNALKKKYNYAKLGLSWVNTYLSQGKDYDYEIYKTSGTEVIADGTLAEILVEKHGIINGLNDEYDALGYSTNSLDALKKEANDKLDSLWPDYQDSLDD